MDRDQHGDRGPPPDIPPEVQAIGRSRPAPSGDAARRKEKNAIVPLDNSNMYSPRARFGLCALRHFTVVIAPETDLLGGWENYSDKERRMYCAAVLGELYDCDYRGLADLLEDNKLFALEAGFDPDNTPHYSTLSRHIRDFDDNVIEEIAEAATNAADHDTFNGYSAFQLLPPKPPKPRQYYEIDIVDEDREISMGQKMGQASQLVAKYMALTSPHIGFGRDESASNFQYPTESFYRLLAHTAIEDCFLKNGYEIFQWQSDDGVDVPPPQTLRKYAKQMGEVEDIEKQFLQATCALLSRESLGLSDKKIHFAYDLTQVPWYGGDHRWTTRSNKKKNTAEFWHYAVISTVSPGRNYVLGATPIKNRTEVSAALDRMLTNIRKHLDPDVGRIYLDRGMYQEDIVKTCRGHGLNWMIQAPDKGRPAELAAEAEKGKPNPDDDIEFAGFEYDQKVNAFAYPLDEDEVGYEERVSGLVQTKITEPGGKKSTSGPKHTRDESNSSLGEYVEGVPELEEENKDGEKKEQNRDGHTVWITDLDVHDRDLKGLNYQFRNRWKVETAIRQMKHDFQGRCGSRNRAVRTLQFGAAQLFFNFWVALNQELPYHLGNPDDIRVTGLETLHAIREADFESAKHGSNRLI